MKPAGIFAVIVLMVGCVHEPQQKIVAKVAEKPCPSEKTREKKQPLRSKDIDCFVWSPRHLEENSFFTLRKRPDGLLLNLVGSNKETAELVYRKLMTEGHPVPGFLGEMGWMMWCHVTAIAPPEVLDRKY